NCTTASRSDATCARTSGRHCASATAAWTSVTEPTDTTTASATRVVVEPNCLDRAFMEAQELSTHHPQVSSTPHSADPPAACGLTSAPCYSSLPHLPPVPKVSGPIRRDCHDDRSRLSAIAAPRDRQLSKIRKYSNLRGPLRRHRFGHGLVSGLH